MMPTVGTSIMIPTLTSPENATAEASSSKISLALRQSVTVEIMGNMTCSFAPAPAEARIARIWVRRVSGWSRPTRTPRSPRKGFSSAGMGR